MVKLSEQELDVKIASFLQDRFSKHPELSDFTMPQASRHAHGTVVSRVKGYSKKIVSSHIKRQTLYQS